MDSSRFLIHGRLAPRLKVKVFPGAVAQFLGSDLGHYVPFVAVAAVALIVDQWSKVFVTGYVQASGQGEIAILGGNVLINPITNAGAAFGVLPNQTVLLTAVAMFIVAA